LLTRLVQGAHGTLAFVPHREGVGQFPPVHPSDFVTVEVGLGAELAQPESKSNAMISFFMMLTISSRL
jgi:hypothetical protein